MLSTHRVSPSHGEDPGQRRDFFSLPFHGKKTTNCKNSSALRKSYSFLHSKNTVFATHSLSNSLLSVDYSETVAFPVGCAPSHGYFHQPSFYDTDKQHHNKATKAPFTIKGSPALSYGIHGRVSLCLSS